MTNNLDRHFSAFGGELDKHYQFFPGFFFLDLTLGDGGHTQEALEAGCRVVSFEVDPEAIQRAISFVPKKYHPIIVDPSTTAGVNKDFNWIIVHSNFSDLNKIVEKYSLPKFDGVMIDLGPSQFQVLSPGRGFSFNSEEPLDMRLDKSLGVTAADLVSALNEGELSDIFKLADEPFARPIARAIVKHRQTSPIKTTSQLSSLVKKIKRTSSTSTIHPATKVFMSLRMVVNLEREVVKNTLPQLLDVLAVSGVIGVISFHSGEDKIVKEFILKEQNLGHLRAINKKPITPSKEELKISNRTRSAKLRLAIKN